MSRRRSFGKNTYKGKRGGRGGRNRWGRGGQINHQNKKKNKFRPSVEGIPLDLPSRMEHKIKALGSKKTHRRNGDWECPKCTFWNFGRRTSCLKCGEDRPEKKVSNDSKNEYDVSLIDIFNYDIMMTLVAYLNVALISRLSCVCTGFRDVMLDNRIWTDFMYHNIIESFYHKRFVDLCNSSTRKPHDYTAPHDLKVNLIIKNITDIVHEVWYINSYTAVKKKLQIVLPNSVQTIKTFPNIRFVFIPVKDYFLKNKKGSNLGVSMKVMLTRVSEVIMSNKRIVTGIEWIIRPKTTQPIKGIGKSYTKDEYTKVMLRNMGITARAFRERKKKANDKISKLDKEIEAAQNVIRRLNNLRNSAIADRGSAIYGEKMLTKK